VKVPSKIVKGAEFAQPSLHEDGKYRQDDTTLAHAALRTPPTSGAASMVEGRGAHD
jgi:hypothetical protein